MITIQLLFVLFLSVAHAFDVPEFTPNVVDETQTLSAQERESVNRAIDEAHGAGVLAAVLLVNRLGGESIEAAAEKVFRSWKLGEKGKDNGVLILVAIADRKMRIEVGYGLEGNITDYHASEIIENELAPKFREGKFAEGLTNAIGLMVKLSRGEFPAYSQPINQSQDDFSNPEIGERLTIWTIGLWLLPALVGIGGFLFALVARRELLQRVRKEEKDLLKWQWLGAGSKATLGLKTFFFVNPGIFIVLFPPLFKDDAIYLLFNVIGIGVILAYLWVAILCTRTIVSERGFSRFLAKKKLKRIHRKKASGGTYTMFGRTYTAPSRSSSSSSSGFSSSSSRSSSSSGGRSGGGGASGSW